MAKEKGADFQRTISEIATLIDGPISAETVSLDAAGMIREGKEYRAVAPECDRQGAEYHRRAEGSLPAGAGGHPHQRDAVLQRQPGAVRRAGGRVHHQPVHWPGRRHWHRWHAAHPRDCGDLPQRSRRSKPMVLSASIRHPRHIIDSALAGADIATCPFKVLEQSMKHPLTDSGIEKFLVDWHSRQ